MSQTDAEIASEMSDEDGSGVTLFLSVPVFGQGPVLVAVVDGFAVVNLIDATIESPTQIHFNSPPAGSVVVWIESAPRLKTRSNGRIIPRPIEITA